MSVFVDDKWLERNKTWTWCGQLCTKKTTWKIQRDDEIKCIYSVARKKGKGWSPTSAVQYRVVLKINDDNGGWRKRPDERKHSLDKITAWSCDMQGHAENALRDVANWQKTCLLFNRWYHRASTITWYHWKMKAIRGNIFHRHLLLYRTRDRLPMRVEFELRAQASSFSSWNVSVRIEVTTGSTHFLLSSKWLAEADWASIVDELDYSGFRVDKHQLELETLDSEIAKGTMKIISADFQRKNNVLEETQHKKETSNAHGQANYVSSIFFNINETQGHTMILSDLLNVELHNDSLKMFNQAWEETLPAFWQWFGQTCLGDLYERRLKKVYTDEAYGDIYQKDVVLKREPRRCQRLRTMVNDIFEQQQQNMLISQKERSRDGSIFFKRGWRRRQRLSILGCQKCLCSKGGESSFEHDTTKKGKGKGNRSRRPVHSDNSAERQYARKPGTVRLEKRSSSVFQLQNRKFWSRSRVWLLASPASRPDSLWLEAWTKWSEKQIEK